MTHNFLPFTYVFHKKRREVTLNMSIFKDIFHVSPNITYEELKNQVNAVNSRLKDDGIEMPNADSLATTRKLYELLGSPLDKIPTIHIGGTNGKGTTAWKIAKCLQSYNLKTGLFVSPHIVCFRERIQIANELITKDDFVKYLSIVMNVCSDNSIPATLFELTFPDLVLLVSLLVSLIANASYSGIVVLEVGLGGRVDATNVVHTALSVICSIALDHTRILGSTVEAIADVKSGIFKSNIPALVGSHTPIELLKTKANEANAPFYTVEGVLQQMLKTDGTGVHKDF